MNKWVGVERSATGYGIKGWRAYWEYRYTDPRNHVCPDPGQYRMRSVIMMSDMKPRRADAMTWRPSFEQIVGAFGFCDYGPLGDPRQHDVAAMGWLGEPEGLEPQL